MNCMKCGREIALGQVFCKECLADMEKYPIKPGTPIQLPIRPAVQPRRQQNHRKVLKPEEQISRLRTVIRCLSALLAVLLLLLALSASALVYLMRDRGEAPLPGQNYSTAGSTTST